MNTAQVFAANAQLVQRLKDARSERLRFAHQHLAEATAALEAANLVVDARVRDVRKAEGLLAAEIDGAHRVAIGPHLFSLNAEGGLHVEPLDVIPLF